MGENVECRKRAMLGALGLSALLFLFNATQILAEQEVENLSGLSRDPEKDIFVVRENGTTCLLAEFAAKFIVPYDVSASNFVDLITETTSIQISRGVEIKGKCGNYDAELQISWISASYTLKLFFVKDGHNSTKGREAFWKMNKVQFIYDSSDSAYFKDAVNPGKYTATTHHLSALVTPVGWSYECKAQQTLSLISTDHQKGVTLLLSEPGRTRTLWLCTGATPDSTFLTPQYF